MTEKYLPSVDYILTLFLRLVKIQSTNINPKSDLSFIQALYKETSVNLTLIEVNDNKILFYTSTVFSKISEKGH